MVYRCVCVGWWCRGRWVLSPFRCQLTNHRLDPHDEVSSYSALLWRVIILELCEERPAPCEWESHASLSVSSECTAAVIGFRNDRKIEGLPFCPLHQRHLRSFALRGGTKVRKGLLFNPQENCSTTVPQFKSARLITVLQYSSSQKCTHSHRHTPSHDTSLRL